VVEFRVIVITGTPGVGKTAVSEELANRLKGLHLSLGDLVIKENLVSGFDGDRRTLIVDLKRLSKRVRSIIGKASQDVVVEGHYAPDVVSNSLAPYVFVLRRDPDDLRVKLEDRGFEERKVLENVASEILDVCLIDAVSKYGSDLVDEIDVTGMSIEEAVEEVLGVLMGRKEAKAGKVDWLGRLEEDGRLGNFLNELNRL